MELKGKTDRRNRVGDFYNRKITFARPRRKCTHECDGECRNVDLLHAIVEKLQKQKKKIIMRMPRRC